jgi:hypothetical protein
MNTGKGIFSALCFLLFILLSVLKAEGQSGPLNLHVGPQPDGSILVPSNQLLRPAGFQVYFSGRDHWM